MRYRTGDLAVVLAWTLLADAALWLVGLGPSLLRVVLVLPLVLLFPGYALLAALYPGTPADERVRRNSSLEGRATLSPLERFAFSVGVSLALVPMVVFVLNFTPFGIRLDPILAGVSGLVVVLTVLGFLSRASAPEGRRHGLDVPFGDWLSRYLSTQSKSLQSPAAFVPETGTQRLLNVLFVVALLVFAGTVGYAAVTPSADQDPFTELYLLQQTDDGEYLAENLPEEFSKGESRTLYVGIGNHERRPVRYTVVVQLEGEVLDRFHTRVGAGETKRVERQVTPTQTGDRLRLSFLLYKGKVPAEPTPENAYREVHLWVTVN